MNLVEPESAGVGGDLFASRRAPAGATPAHLAERGFGSPQGRPGRRLVSLARTTRSTDRAGSFRERRSRDYFALAK
jgi:hypothetical protein